MKLFKKTAALLFCLALVFGVMAISALADDEAELLALNVAAVSNTDFTVTLEKADASNAILNRDASDNTLSNNGYEINAGEEVTFDIKLSYAKTGANTDFASKTIEGLSFVVVAPNGVTVKDTTVKINSVDIGVSSGTGAQTNTYVYTAASTSTALAVPSSKTAIGEITFVFSNSAATDTKLSPSITDIKISLDDTQQPQKPADATLDYPVYINPTYTATVEHFKVSTTTGVLEKKGQSDPTPTSSVTYYFSTGANLTNEDPFPGYEFQGWMVTANTNSSTTWAEFNSSASGAWNTSTSYTSDSSRVITQDWTNAKNATAENDKLTKYVTGYKTAVGTGEETVVMFIPVNTADNATATAMPTHMAGNITLTPVYTATQYTVTFRADNPDDTNSKANFGKDDEQQPITQTTATYTIEDVATDGASSVQGATDFLDFYHNQSGKNSALNKPAFKFVGWLPSGSTVAEADTSYKWTNNDYTTTTLATAVSTLVHPQKMRYGDVTMTAIWEVDAYYAEIGYQYAGATDNAMILVGVPKATYVSDYTYKFDGNAMFIIPDVTDNGTTTPSAQKTAYKNAGVAAEAFTDFTEANLTDNYVLFAYIANAASSDMKKVTIDETKFENVTVNYDCDVDDDNSFTVADFGNVHTLLSKSGNTNNVFAISTSDGVKARLQADVYTTGDSSSNAFASIGDIVTIYNAMGYDMSPTNPTGA